MPIYEYLCDKCAHEFEAEQRITDDPIRTCPQCRSRKVRRLISQTSFVLKGSGWYSDLYSSRNAKSDSAPKEDSSAKEAGPDAAAASGSTSADESAPASKGKKESDTAGKGKGKKAGAKAA